MSRALRRSPVDATFLAVSSIADLEIKDLPELELELDAELILSSRSDSISVLWKVYDG